MSRGRVPGPPTGALRAAALSGGSAASLLGAREPSAVSQAPLGRKPQRPAAPASCPLGHTPTAAGPGAESAARPGRAPRSGSGSQWGGSPPRLTAPRFRQKPFSLTPPDHTHTSGLRFRLQTQLWWRHRPRALLGPDPTCLAAVPGPSPAPRGPGAPQCCRPLTLASAAPFPRGLGTPCSLCLECS